MRAASRSWPALTASAARASSCTARPALRPASWRSSSVASVERNGRRFEVGALRVRRALSTGAAPRSPPLRTFRSEGRRRPPARPFGLAAPAVARARVLDAAPGGIAVVGVARRSLVLVAARTTARAARASGRPRPPVRGAPVRGAPASLSDSGRGVDRPPRASGRPRPPVPRASGRPPERPPSGRPPERPRPSDGADLRRARPLEPERAIGTATARPPGAASAARWRSRRVTPSRCGSCSQRISGRAATGRRDGPGRDCDRPRSARRPAARFRIGAACLARRRVGACAADLPLLVLSLEGVTLPVGRPAGSRRSPSQPCINAMTPASKGGRHLRKNRRRPTLPGGLPPSTIGAGGLNCRVRNGNGCVPAAMATGSSVSLGVVSEHSIASTNVIEERCMCDQALGRLVPVG